MCKNCLILGALINAGSSQEKGDVFPSQTLAQFDMIYTEQDSLIDRQAEAYLAETLTNFRKIGIDVVPIQVTSDGSCLPHAVSRALVGFEVFYDCLRASMVKELTEHSQWYKEHDYGGVVSDDETWAVEWQRILLAAQPTHGARVGEDKYLGGIHILALANILRRPIIVLDTPDNMTRLQAQGFDGLGLYPPCRHSREELIATNNRCLSPVMIAWKSHSHDHFVAVVPRQLSVIEEITACDANGKSQMAQWDDFGFTVLRNRQVKSALKILELVSTTAPTTRDAACVTIKAYLENVKKFVDNPSDNAKYCRIALDNKNFKHDILSVKYALDALLLLGFEEKSFPNSDGVIKPFLTFPSNPQDAMIAILSKNHDVILSLLNYFIPGGSLRGVPYPGQGEVTSEVDMELLFGAPKPLLFPDWKTAVNEYGNGEKALSSCAGSAWSFGSGRSADTFVSSILSRGMNNFNVLEKGRFGRWNSKFPTMLSTPSLAASLCCPVCLNLVTWPVQSVDHLELMRDSQNHDVLTCSPCLMRGRITKLSIQQTFYLEILSMLKQAYSSTARLWKCVNEECQVANFDTHLRCHICHSERPVEVSAVLAAPASDDKQLVAEGTSSTETKSTESKAKDTTKWICLECRKMNSLTVTKCSACYSEKGSEPSFFTDLDESERQHIVSNSVVMDSNEDDDDALPTLVRAFSAVVYSTTKDLTEANASTPKVEANEDSLPDMKRLASAPVTSSEKVKAKKFLSPDAVALEGTWRELLSAILGEIQESEEEPGRYSIRLDLKLV